MKKYYLLFSACLLLSACSVPVKYIGDKYAASSNKLDVYYAAHDVKHNFKVIGHLTTPLINGSEKIKERLTTYAQNIGADAIIITNMRQDAENVTADALKYTDK